MSRYSEPDMGLLFSMKTYAEKLKDPRWQKKRLRIFNRDNWRCQSCLSVKNTLHVHHKMYMNGVEPWEYEDAHLITLCEFCHKNAHGQDVKWVLESEKRNPEITRIDEPDVIVSINQQIGQLTEKLNNNIDLGLESEILKNLMYLYDIKKTLKNG